MELRRGKKNRVRRSARQIAEGASFRYFQVCLGRPLECEYGQILARALNGVRGLFKEIGQEPPLMAVVQLGQGSTRISLDRPEKVMAFLRKHSDRLWFEEEHETIMLRESSVRNIMVFVSGLFGPSVLRLNSSDQSLN